MKTRNEEYNEFLREKQFKHAHRMDHKKPGTAVDDVSLACVCNSMATLYIKISAEILYNQAPI